VTRRYVSDPSGRDCKALNRPADGCRHPTQSEEKSQGIALTGFESNAFHLRWSKSDGLYCRMRKLGTFDEQLLGGLAGGFAVQSQCQSRDMTRIRGSPVNRILSGASSPRRCLGRHEAQLSHEIHLVENNAEA
jgi:hypothetical protein